MISDTNLDELTSQDQPAAAGTAQQPPPAPSAKPGRDGFAVAALVLGLVSIPFFFLFVPGVLAIVFGLVARQRIKRSSARGRGAARAGVILGLLTMAGAVIGIALTGSGEQVDYIKLSQGDCFSVPSADVGVSGPRLVSTGIDRQACTEPHQREVILVVDHPAAPRAAYPGTTELLSYASEKCARELPVAAGAKLLQNPTLGVYGMFPTSMTWAAGERRIVCAVANRDGSPLVGSFIGS